MVALVREGAEKPVREGVLGKFPLDVLFLYLLPERFGVEGGMEVKDLFPYLLFEAGNAPEEVAREPACEAQLAEGSCAFGDANAALRFSTSPAEPSEAL